MNDNLENGSWCGFQAACSEDSHQERLCGHA